MFVRSSGGIQGIGKGCLPGRRMTWVELNASRKSQVSMQSRTGVSILDIMVHLSFHCTEWTEESTVGFISTDQKGPVDFVEVGTIQRTDQYVAGIMCSIPTVESGG